MPTILRFEAFRIMIYTDDHDPPHVHVVGDGGAKASIWFDCNTGHCSARKNDGLSRQELRIALQLCRNNIDKLCENWRRLHVHAL